jgi:ATP-dependent helicase HrpA
MREWDDIHAQIVQVMREWDFAPNEQPASGEQLHRALLPGLLSKIGMWNQETRSYMGARQTKFLLHPSSGLAKKPPQWVMAAELVETSQLFARTVAKIDPLWLEQAGGDLCKRSYGDPHWEQRAAQVVAKEQVTLYGLPIVKNRSVSYATIDPKLSRELFITHALVRHEYTSKGAFMEHNRRLLDEVQRLRDKARKSDMVADEYALYDFFDERIPESVVSGKTFEAWRREAEAKNPRILFLDRENILLEESKDLSPARYPDKLGPQLPLTYVFDPGADDDGITVTVPLAMLPQLDPDELTWTIPGWHREKLRALLDSLGKAMRKQLGFLDELADQLAAQLKPFDGPMLPAVEKKIFELTGVRITRDAWDLREVPAYLWFGYRVVDEHDKVLAEGRDLVELQGKLGRRASELWSRAPRAKYERTGLTTWDFESLPASVNVDGGGRKVLAYPALVESEHAVDIKLLESPAAAAAASREGLRRLFMLGAGLKMSVLEGQLPLSLGATRKQIVLHALDDAFETHAMPASRAAFQDRLATGRARLPDTLGNLVRIAVDLYAELDRARALIKPLLQRPGPTRAALDDIQKQLQQLVPADLMRATPAARLVHVTRYIKAVITRLHRLGHDLPKDQQKAAQVMPFVQRFEKLPPSPERDELRWLLEEFRVQIFAPELKTAVSVSPQRLEDAYARVPR